MLPRQPWITKSSASPLKAPATVWSYPAQDRKGEFNPLPTLRSLFLSDLNFTAMFTSPPISEPALQPLGDEHNQKLMANAHPLDWRNPPTARPVMTSVVIGAGTAESGGSRRGRRAGAGAKGCPW